MLTRLQNHFGTAGLIVAIVALTAALSGGAYAASGGLSGKQKKEVEKIAKKFAGKPGATGPAGATGSAGAPGKDGTNGTNGTNGKGTETGTATASECPEGGATVQVAGEPGTKKKICNGSPWPAGGTLPSGESLTGTWAVGRTGVTPEVGASTFVYAPISFPIPLVAAGEDENGEVDNEIPVTYLTKAAPPTAGCPGSFDAPAAEPGNLCVYTAQSNEVEFSEETNPENGLGGFGAGKSGVVMVFKMNTAVARARGSWVLTAP